jgi:hypothetical protein
MTEAPALDQHAKRSSCDSSDKLTQTANCHQTSAAVLSMLSAPICSGSLRDPQLLAKRAEESSQEITRQRC